MAANFLNLSTGANGGVIEVGDLVNLGFDLLVSATNIVNSGVMLINPSSLIRLEGEDIDLSQGTIEETTSLAYVTTNYNNIPTRVPLNSTVLDTFWGVGSMTNIDVSSFSQSVITPPNFNGTLRNFTSATLGVYSNSYTFTNGLVPLNIYGTTFVTNYPSTNGSTYNSTALEAVFVNIDNTNFSTRVFFDPVNGIVVQWTNASHSFYLKDNFGEITNLQVIPSGVVIAANSFTFKPYNYTFATGLYTNTSPAAPPISNAGLDFGAPITATNNYAAWAVEFAPGTSLITDSAGGNATNVPDRIEIVANRSLNLSNASISALNYILLRATNNFISSQGASISAPTIDVQLRTTNGILQVAGLVRRRSISSTVPS